MLGQEVDVHHARVRQIRDDVETLDRRGRRAPADIDEDRVGLEDLVADTHRPRPLEPSVTHIDRAVRHAAQPALDALVRAPHDGVLARLDPLHVDPNRALQHYAEVSRAARDMGRLGAGDERLGRDAAGIDAGPAEPLSLDDRDARSCARQAVRQRGAGLPSANDDRVVGHRHGASLPLARWQHRIGRCSGKQSDGFPSRPEVWDQPRSPRARRPSGPASTACRILRLALLASDIVEAILGGWADQRVMLERLERPLPVGWEGQRAQMYGG